MSLKNPWINATLSGFHDDDPKNDQRRDLLIEASSAVPPDWGSTTPEDDNPPPCLRRSSRFRWVWINLSLFLISTFLLWCLVFSPQAQKRLGGIVLSDMLIQYVSSPSFVGPLKLIYPVNDGYGDVSAWVQHEMIDRISPENQLLCCGDPSAHDQLSKWTVLWESDPSNPALFAERIRFTLPFDEDTLEATLHEADQIDPGNGYYRLLAAIELTERGIELAYPKIPGTLASTKMRRRPRPKKQWQVKDPESYKQAWNLLDQALHAPRNTSHISEILESRLDDWHPPLDYPDFSRDITWLYWGQPSVQAFPSAIHDLAYLFTTKARELTNTESITEMIQLCKDWRLCLSRLNQMDRGPWRVFDAWGFVNQSAESMESACSSLGMPTEERFFASHSALKRTTSAISGLAGTGSGSEGSNLSQELWINPGADPTPGRLAEHRMYESLYLTAAPVILLTLALITATITCFSSLRLQGLPTHLAGALKPADHLRIFLFGVLLPGLIVVASMEIPWIHPRDETFGEDSAASFLLKLAALITAIPCLTSRQIILALARRAQPLRFTSLSSRAPLLLGLLALGTALTSSALFRIKDIPGTHHEEWVWLGFFGLLGLIWLILLFSMGVLMISGARRIQTATGAQILIRHLVVASCSIALLVPAYRKVEKHWVTLAMSERIDTPEALSHLRSESPELLSIRQAIEDYLETAPNR